jgi:Flp pilus assembly protein TadG
MRPKEHERLEAMKRITSTVRRVVVLARHERGAAVVEFAVLLPVLLLILFGILDFGRAMNYKNELTQLANQAARSAAVNRNPSDGSAPFPDCSALKSYLSDPVNVDTSEIAGMIGDSSQNTVEITRGATVGDPVTVRLTAKFGFLPFIGNAMGAGSADLTGEATMRLEQVPSTSGVESC